MPDFFLSLPGGVIVLASAALGVSSAIARRVPQIRGAAATPPLATRAMQMILSLVIVAAALYVILGKPGALDDRKWAYSAIALVLGFWLRGPIR
jgi:hypothetical protein